MQLIQDFERFPFEVRQPPDRDWCIPASIEVVAKYHMPNSTLTQAQILREFVTTKGLEQIGLKSIQEVLGKYSAFSWADIRYCEEYQFHGAFNALVSFLEECVDENRPAIISVPIPPKNWHMLTVLGYDREFLRVYDPSPFVWSAYCDVTKLKIQGALRSRKLTSDTTDALIISPNARATQDTHTP
jgi:hypothetical protein